MHLLGNAVEEHISVPLMEHDNRGTAEEVEETGYVEAKSMVDWDDIECNLNSLRGVPHRWLAKGSGNRRK